MYILMLSLIFALLVAIFAVQNAAPVTINLFWGVKEVPLVLVIFASAVAGALIVFLLALWREFKRKNKKPVEKAMPKGQPNHISRQQGQPDPTGPSPDLEKDRNSKNQHD